jgi:hydrogenase maturation protease
VSSHPGNRSGTRQPLCVPVVGIGNDARGDDAAGPAVVRWLREELPEGFPAELLEVPGLSTTLIDVWEGKDLVILVDAVRSGLPAGTVHRIDALSVPSPLPAGFSRGSTHALDLDTIIGLGRSLGRLPGLLVVYGIEGACFDEGAGLSAGVRRAIPETAERIAREVSKAAGRRGLRPRDRGA